MQFQALTNSLVGHNHSRSVRIRNFSVTPISHRAGLIEWIENVKPLYEIYTDWKRMSDDRQRLLEEDQGNPVIFQVIIHTCVIFKIVELLLCDTPSYIPHSCDLSSSILLWFTLARPVFYSHWIMRRVFLWRQEQQQSSTTHRIPWLISHAHLDFLL